MNDRIKALLYKQQWPQCLELLQQAARTSPKDATVFYDIGRCLLAMGNTGAAVEALGKAVELAPENDRYYHVLRSAERTLADQEPAGAEAFRDRAQSAEDHLFRGDRLRYRRDMPGALQEYAKAVELDPNTARYRVYLGVGLYLNGRREEARHQYLKAFELDPNCADAHHFYGDALYDLHDYSGANWHWRQALRLGCSDREHLERDIARALAAQGWRWRALWQLKRAENGEIHTTEGLAIRAHLSLDLWDWSESIKRYRVVVARNPNHPPAHARLGLFLLKQARWRRSKPILEEARQSIERALALNPSDLTGGIAMSCYKRFSGDRRSAIDLSRRLVDEHQTNGNAILNLQHHLLASFAFSEALRLQMTLIRLSLTQARERRAARQAYRAIKRKSLECIGDGTRSPS